MKAKVLGQLGMECGHEHVPLPCHHRMAVHLRKHLHPVTRVLDPGRADEDRPQRLVPETLDVHVRSKLRIWRPKALRRASMSIRPRCARSSMISPAQVPNTGRPPPHEVRIG